MGHPGKIATRRISNRLRELRTARGWTQVELAGKLGLSQSRLSSIERGTLSLSAEEFLEVLQLFNVPASEFAAPEARGTAADQLQNALERLGALHLREDSRLLPSEQVKQAHAVIREVLIAADSPRHITALAPVLVAHAETLNFSRLVADLSVIGMNNRLHWLTENVLAALDDERKRPIGKSWQRAYEGAFALLQYSAAFVPSPREPRPDLLDHGLRSPKSVQLVAENSSHISKRWNIVTAIQVDDFVEALRASRVADH